MIRLLTISALIFSLLFMNIPRLLAADKGAGEICNQTTDKCPTAYSCQQYDGSTYLCAKKIIPIGDECNPANADTICFKGYSCQFYDPGKRYICTKTSNLGVGEKCKPGVDKCITNYSCQMDRATNTPLCLKSAAATAFGAIQAPDILKGFLQKDPTGAGAISQFLSNLISLIYLFAGIILVFMLMWGAFDWITSEGEKEKLDSARKKIINALIGMVLLALVFAIIRVFGMFTGFRFFSDQNFRVVSRDPTTGAILTVKCLKSKQPDFPYNTLGEDPEVFCSKKP